MSIKDQIASMLSDHNAEHKRLVEYVVAELEQGRNLDDVIGDPYVTNRLSPVQRRALLEEPEIVRAAGDEALAEMRAHLEALAGD